MEIAKENYTVCFNEKGAVTSLVSGGKQFVKEVLPLFQFMFRCGDTYTSDDADEINITKENDALRARFVYKEPSIVFTADIKFEKRIEATVRFENNTGEYVEWIDFLQIAVPNDLVRTGGSGRLVFNINEGLLIEDISAKEQFEKYAYRDLNYPSEGLYSMFPAVVQSQFLAYYDDTSGIYICAEDKERGIKGIDFMPIGEGIKLQFRLYTGADGVSFELPFSMVIDFFKGDWHECAKLYRDWFENNLPEGLVSVENDSYLPEWYTDSPLVVTYPVQGVHDMDEAVPNRLFPYNNALPIIDELASAVNSRVMALLMHWEGTAPWAPPYVWPPLGGEQKLIDFCEKLHEKNHLLGVYCSGISYTLHSNINDYNMQDEYEKLGLSRYMCTAPDGTIESKICQKQRKSYDMCISQDFTKDVILKESESMVSCGLDYIQILDQNHGGTPYMCYSDKHGHPAVPGKWMVEHMTDLLEKLKAKVGDNVLLGCESAAAEAYIPYLKLSDNRFNLNYAAGRPIPLYGYVYHKYLHNFSGNSVSSLKFIDAVRSPECHLMRVAHSFLAGDIMTLVINQDGEIAWSWGQKDFSTFPERAPILEFIKTATAYRRGVGKKYLVFGEMIKPRKVTCESVPMYKPDTDYMTEFPAVLTTAWQASDGTTAQFLASYRKTEEKCTLDLTGTLGAKLIDENGHVLKILDPEKCEITIPANSVRMIMY